MNKLLFIPVFVLLLSCNGAKPRESVQGANRLLCTLDFGSFQIKTPANWQKIKLRGIDSYVGGMTNGIDTLVFDYGMYSDELTDKCEKQLYANVTVNGKSGYITKPKIKGQGVLGVYFGDIDGSRFNLAAYRFKSDEDTMISIFRNIKFKTSDTTINSAVLEFAPKDCN